MEADDFYLLGTIVRSHGVRGNVVVRTDVDDPEVYKKTRSVFIKADDGTFEQVTVSEVSLSGDHLIMHLDGIEDVDTAKTFQRTELFLPVSGLPKLSGKNIYLHEAMGMTVIDKIWGELGIIEKIYDLPEQPVCSVQFREKEILFPLLTVFIEKVDRENKILYTELPEGLIDIYLA